MTGVAVVGTGYWGRNHVRNFKELLDEGTIDNLKLCDLSLERVKALASSFDLEYTTDYDEILNDDKFDAISIATPSPLHYEMSRTAIEHGKSVLVEKPMTMTSEEAKELVKFTKDSDGILMVGHIFRHHSAVKELKKRINRGDFGNLHYMYCNRMAFRVPRQDMGVLHALGIHEVDIFCYLLDKKYPNEIYTHCETHYFSGIEETALILLKFNPDITCYAFETWMSPVSAKKRDLVVIGNKMSARIDYLKPQELQIFDSAILPKKGSSDDRSENESSTLEPGVTDYELEQEGSYTIPIEYKEPLREELLHFLNCAKNHKQPISDMYSGQRAVEMIEIAFESAKTGKNIKMEL